MACNNCNECNPCSPMPCVQETCSCPVFITSDCVEQIKEDMPYTGIASGKTFNEWILALDEYLQNKFTSIENFFKLKNVGAGIGKIYKGISILGEKEIKSILGTDLITITNLTDEVEIAVNESALSAFIGDAETYSVTNIGTGANVYKDSTILGVNTQFNLRKINTSNSGTGAILLKPQVENTNDISIIAKSLKSSNNSVTITAGTDDIDLSVVVDTVITDSSQNPITSNAVFDALAAGTIETKKEYIVIPLSDLTTNLTIGTSKAYFRMPFAAVINSVRASVLVAQTAGSILTFDINESGVSLLSTKLTIDNNEKTSLTATTPPVVSDTSLADDAEITFDIDQVGTAGAKGAVITLLVTRV